MHRKIKLCCNPAKSFCRICKTVPGTLAYRLVVVEATFGNDRSFANLTIKHCGMFYDEMLPVLMDDFEGRKRKVENMLNMQNSDIHSFDFQQEDGKIPVLKLVASMELRNLYAEVNKRLMVPVTLLKRTEIRNLSPRERKSDIYIERSFMVCDSVRFIIPEQFRIEQIPAKQQLVTPFGRYTLQLTAGENTLLVVRTLVFNKGIYPRQEYDRFYAFFDAINTFDTSKIILRND